MRGDTYSYSAYKMGRIFVFVEWVTELALYTSAGALFFFVLCAGWADETNGEFLRPANFPMCFLFYVNLVLCWSAGLNLAISLVHAF